MKSLLCYLSLISAHTLSSLHCLLTMTPLRLHNQISSQAHHTQACGKMLEPFVLKIVSMPNILPSL